MYHYQWGIGILLHVKYRDQEMGNDSMEIYTNLVDKETKVEFTDQENTMLAISSLAIVFSIIEIILAFASAKSCSGHDTPQENQVKIITKKIGVIVS